MTDNDLKVMIYNAMMINQHNSAILAGLITELLPNETFTEVEDVLLRHTQTYIFAVNQLIDSWNNYAVVNPVNTLENEDLENSLNEDSVDQLLRAIQQSKDNEKS